MPEKIEEVLGKQWFYSYELPDGRRTETYHDGSLDAIHETRWQMLERGLLDRFPNGFDELTAMDLACHQGYFAIKLAALGFTAVQAVDARQSHVEDSRLIASVYEHSNLRFEQSDVFDLDAATSGEFDVVLMLGLLYHLENPVGALRVARALCRNCCIIETQVVPGLSGYVDYGSYQFVRPLKGSFGLIDETGETHGPEAGISGICLVPSLEALIWVLENVGFRKVSLVEPPPDAYEQHLYHKRVMVIASV